MKFFHWNPLALEVHVDRDAPVTRKLPDGTVEDVIGFVIGNRLVIHPDRLEELEAATVKKSKEE